MTLPLYAGKTVTPSPALLFEYLPGKVDLNLTATRTSVATLRDRQDRLVEVGPGVLRDGHWVHDENGVLVRSTKLEDSRTNNLTRSEEFDHADWGTQSGVTVVTVDGLTAPDGSVTAEELSSTTGSNGILQNASVAASTQQVTLSCWVQQGSADSLAIRALAGGTTTVGQIEYTWSTDSFNLALGADDVGVAERIGDWVRLYLVVTNDGSSSMQFRGLPDTGGNGDSTWFWGAQVEDSAAFPSSYVATTTAAVTRSADSLSFDISGTPLATPQEMTVYGKVVFHGGSYLFKIGTDTDFSSPRTSFRSLGGSFEGLYQDAAGTTVVSDTGVSDATSIGAVIEYRSTLAANGDFQSHVSVDGAAEISGPLQTGADIDAGSWTENTLHIGHGFGTGAPPAIADFLALTISPGVKTMSEMRLLAGRA